MDGLVEGRIVHYVAYNGRHLAAMVIGVEDKEAGVVDLVMFTNMKNVAGKKTLGQQFHQDVEHSLEPRPGTWHFIEGAPTTPKRSVNVQGSIHQSVIITGNTTL